MSNTNKKLQGFRPPKTPADIPPPFYYLASDFYRYYLENAYSGNNSAPETPEPEPIDMEAHSKEMADAFFDAVMANKQYTLLILAQSYAIVGQRVNLSIHVKRGAAGFNPLEDQKHHELCMVKVFVWADDAMDDEIVKRSLATGARAVDLYVVEDIKEKLV